MGKEMEYETRVMLSEEQYFTIASFYLTRHGYHPFIDQTNYYYDTPDRILRSKHIIIRIRHITHKRCELTLKIKGDNGDIEVNQYLSYNEYHRLMKRFILPKGAVYDELLEKGLPISGYNLIGSLSTKRLEVKEDNYLVVIDKNTYENVTDYDLEIESSSMEISENTIKDICLTYGVEYKNGYKSKSRRLFELLEKN